MIRFTLLVVGALNSSACLVLACLPSQSVLSSRDDVGIRDYD